MNQPLITPELLQKYLEEKCTDSEKAVVEDWYASLKGTPGYLDTLSDKDSGSLQVETFLRIQEELALGQTSTPPGAVFLPGRYWRWGLGAAASLVLLAGIWIGYGKLDSSSVFEKNAQTDQSVLSSANLIRFVNEEPRLVLHALPDGSTVWLRADAAIIYPATFEANRRLVKFEGEGFFDVKSDKKRPFVIQSGEMRVEVLGTRFNVKAPPREMIYEVSVVSGSVAVSAPNREAATQKVVLAPKQQALFEIQNKRLTSNTIPAEARKEIYEPVTILFEGAPLEYVTEQLSRRFDVRVHLVNPAMKSCRLTADFEQQPLPAILEMLCATLDATYTMAGKTILIEGEACE